MGSLQTVEIEIFDRYLHFYPDGASTVVKYITQLKSIFDFSDVCTELIWIHLYENVDDNFKE
jgi:hypothetical protein